jgi:DNA-binding TFAR19-related protein (PDSD5 family)
MCPECEARRKLARDALVKAKIGEALGHVVKGVAEMSGVKEKTGNLELKAKKFDQGIPRNKPQ